RLGSDARSAPAAAAGLARRGDAGRPGVEPRRLELPRERARHAARDGELTMSVHVSAFQNPVAFVVMFVFGIVLFVRGFRTWRERRLIQNTPPAKIRSMAMGLVEINGTVEPRSVLAGPFSGQSCAFWEVDISSRTKDGWRVVHRNASGHPFFIQDGTASALV